MKEEDLRFIVREFVTGLLQYAKVEHAGNCLMMSHILHAHLKVFYEIDTEMINVKVKQGRKRINHYILKMNNGNIIDGTSSQFKGMPLVYIGAMPESYLLTNLKK